MINVGFFPAVSKKWLGGVNYYKNLLYAISTVSNSNINPIVFVGYKSDPDVVQQLALFSIVIKSSIFDKWSPMWFFHRLFVRLFRTEFFLERLLQKNNVEVVSHSNLFFSNKIKVISWIPDFQHTHLPDMFTDTERLYRDSAYRKVSSDSDKVILSSNSAFNDYKNLFPELVGKAEVLQFVSQPDSCFMKLSCTDFSYIEDKYNLVSPFYYVPNQFWKHKNHKVLFQSVKILKDKGVEVKVLCSGLMDDYRNSGYIDELKQFVVDNDLQDNVVFLGLIDYSDVFSLMSLSRAVINPSLFEGWSSTVEECKSINKKMILSDIDVHIEQYPEAMFFSKNNPHDLACKIESFCLNESDVANSIRDIDERTKDFANKYIEIVNSLF